MKNRFMKSVIVTASLCSLSLSLMANDNQQAAQQLNEKDLERQYIQSVLPSTNFTKYEKSRELEGYYKIYMDNGEMFFVSPFKGLVIFGADIWTRNGQSLTQKDMQRWQQELQEKQLVNLSPDKLTKDALEVKFGKGSSQYDFVIFTDPECPYCKKAEDTFKNKDVTVYVNFMPLDFHKNAKRWSLDVLSSKEPLKTLEDIKSGKEPKLSHTKQAEEQLSKMEALGKELNITGTPKLFVIDKKENKIVDVINGANIPQIEKYLK